MLNQQQHNSAFFKATAKARSTLVLCLCNNCCLITLENVVFRAKRGERCHLLCLCTTVYDKHWKTASTHSMSGQEVWTPPFLETKLPQIIHVVAASWEGELSPVEVKLLKKITLGYCVVPLCPGPHIWSCEGMATTVYQLGVTCLVHLRKEGSLVKTVTVAVHIFVVPLTIKKCTLVVNMVWFVLIFTNF